MKLVFVYYREMIASDDSNGKDSGQWHICFPMSICVEEESKEELLEKFYALVKPLYQEWEKYWEAFEIWEKEGKEGREKMGGGEIIDYSKKPQPPQTRFDFYGYHFCAENYFPSDPEPQIYTLEEWFDEFKVEI